MAGLWGCDGFWARDECPGFIHRINRLVTVSDTREIIQVGDTLTFTFLLPWEVTTLFNYELQDSFSFDLRDAPEPTNNSVGWHPQYAPLGPAGDFNGPVHGVSYIEKIVRRGGNDIGYMVGDSTARGLESEMSLVLKQPGRYYFVFFNERLDTTETSNNGIVHEYIAYNLTRSDGCPERVGIHTKATNYSTKREVVEAHNAMSEIKMQVRIGSELLADYYVLVQE